MVSDIVFEEMPKDWTDYREIKLPVSKYTVVLSTPRLWHDEKLTKMKKEDEETPGRVLDFFIRTITIEDTNGKEVPKEDWIEFYESIPASDRDAITKEFEPITKPVRATVTCPKCGEVNKIYVPISPDFFRLTGE